MSLTDAPSIFVVDDDESVRTAMRRLLLSLGLSIRMFSSAEQFLSEIKPGIRGCLILDVRLPGMSGLQLQEQLAKEHWNLPTLIVTAHDDEETRDLAVRQGAIAYLKKPFQRHDLLTGVNVALARCTS